MSWAVKFFYEDIKSWSDESEIRFQKKRHATMYGTAMLKRVSFITGHKVVESPKPANIHIEVEVEEQSPT